VKPYQSGTAMPLAGSRVMIRGRGSWLFLTPWRTSHLLFFAAHSQMGSFVSVQRCPRPVRSSFKNKHFSYGLAQQFRANRRHRKLGFNERGRQL